MTYGYNYRQHNIYYFLKIRLIAYLIHETPSFDFFLQSFLLQFKLEEFHPEVFVHYNGVKVSQKQQ